MQKTNEQGFVVLLIPVVIILVVIIAIAASNNKQPTTKENNPLTSTAHSNQQSITESDAEAFCQDSALLGKYMDMSKVKIVDMANYNKYYSDAGEKDANGTPLKILQWNGKIDGISTLFVCTISGTADNIQLQGLSVGGQDLYTASN